MRTTRNDDGSLYTRSEWFIAKITAVCTKEDLDCRNYPCSWAQMVYCDNMQGLTEDESGTLFGDCEAGVNVAYPISGVAPAVGEIVLMRFRGSVDQEENAFEFVSGGGGGTVFSDSCCRVLNAECSLGYLAVTYSDSCIQTTTSTTSTSSTSTTSTTSTTQSPLDFLSTSPLPKGTEGTPYGFAFVPNGGCLSYVQFLVVAGSLPPGLSLNPTTGVLSGTPTTPGTYNFTIEVTDSCGNTAQFPYELTIDPFSVGDFISINAAGDDMLINVAGDKLTWG